MDGRWFMDRSMDTAAAGQWARRVEDCGVIVPITIHPADPGIDWGSEGEPDLAFDTGLGEGVSRPGRVRLGQQSWPAGHRAADVPVRAARANATSNKSM